MLRLSMTQDVARLSKLVAICGNFPSTQQEEDSFVFPQSQLKLLVDTIFTKLYFQNSRPDGKQGYRELNVAERELC